MYVKEPMACDQARERSDTRRNVGLRQNWRSYRLCRSTVCGSINRLANRNHAKLKVGYGVCLGKDLYFEFDGS